MMARNIKNVPYNLCKCHPSASILAVAGGLSLHGKAVLILHQNVMTHSDGYHEGHQGYVKTLLYAQNVIFWP